MEAIRKKIRQQRLQKYGRILSRRYALNVYLNSMRALGYTDSTNKVVICSDIAKNDFKNLVLQKAVVLHEIGHVLYTNSDLWMHQGIDHTIVNIVEDGRIEERISREYSKARLYFIYLNQERQKIKADLWKKAYINNPEKTVLDAMLRVAKKSTGIPQLPQQFTDLIITRIGGSNYDYIMNNVQKAVETEDEQELYDCVNNIDSKMNTLFPKDLQWLSRPDPTGTSKDSLDKCGKTSLKQKDQSEADKALVKKLEEELEKQAQKVADEASNEAEDQEVKEETSGSVSSGSGEEVEDEDGEFSESVSESTSTNESDDNSDSEETETSSDDDKPLPGGTNEADEEHSGLSKEELDELEESGILDGINEQLENESLTDIRQESSIIQANSAEADFSDYGEQTDLDYIWSKKGPISPKNLDPIAHKISHLFKAIASTGDGWTHNQTRGRLEMHKLTSLMSGSSRPRVFKRNDKIKEVDLSACILVDCSSSMDMEYRYVQAMRATYTITKALELGNYNSEVLAFFGGSDIHGIKSFNQKIEYAMHEFAPFYNGGTPLHRCLVGAEKSLAKQSSKRKVIIVVTDGAPNDHEACTQKIKQLEAKGITVIGVLIRTNNFYGVFNQRHTVSCYDINKLPVLMTEMIKKVLLTIRRS